MKKSKYIFYKNSQSYTENFTFCLSTAKAQRRKAGS